MKPITSLDNGLKPVFCWIVQYLFENDQRASPHEESYESEQSAITALGNIVAEKSRGALLHASISRRYK